VTYPTPTWVWARWNFAKFFGIRKLRVPALSYGGVCVILGSAGFLEHRLVTDRRTDGRSHDDSIYRASIASRGNYLRAEIEVLSKPKIVTGPFNGPVLFCWLASVGICRRRLYRCRRAGRARGQSGGRHSTTAGQ